MKAPGKSSPRDVVLSGSLDAFHCYDVCEWLKLAGHSGLVRVASIGGVVGEMVVEGGVLVSARIHPNPRRLGRILLDQAAVSAADLGEALERQVAGDRRRLGAHLQEVAGLTDAALQRALVTQVDRAFRALLLLPTGRFVVTRSVPTGYRFLRTQQDPALGVLEALADFDELKARL